MLKSLLTTVAGAALIVPALLALPAPQGGGGLGTDSPSTSGDSFVGGTTARVVVTPAQQVAERLKLDPKTQVPAVEQIFSEARQEAGPIGQQMLQLRQQLVNLALNNKADEMKPVVDAYTAAAAKMTGIETRAFAKIYATLKSNQQSNAAQAFALMGGMFQPPAPSAAGARGGRRGRGDL